MVDNINITKTLSIERGGIYEVIKKKNNGNRRGHLKSYLVGLCLTKPF